MAQYFGKAKSSNEKISRRNLVQELEEILGLARSDWPSSLLRALWDDLKRGITRRGRSLQHETAWLSLAGFVLRPGFGCEGDAQRIAELWRLAELGLNHRKEARANVQWWILWRRVSGGLSLEQQEWLLKQAEKSLSKKDYSPMETYRLIGSLELLPVEKKVQLAKTLVKQFTKGKIDEATAWAFGRLASRIAVTASKDSVIAPDYVETWFSQLSVLDWSLDKYAPLATAFQLAARESTFPEHNLGIEVREAVVEKLKQSGCSEEQVRPLQTFVPLKAADEQKLFGESLPMGLHLL